MTLVKTGPYVINVDAVAYIHDGEGALEIFFTGGVALELSGRESEALRPWLKRKVEDLDNPPSKDVSAEILR